MKRGGGAMDTVSGVSFEIRGATKGKRIRGCLQSEGLPRAREREQRKIEMRRAAKRIIPRSVDRSEIATPRRRLSVRSPRIR